MPSIGTGINSLRSLVFVRNFGGQIIENTDVSVQTDSGNIKLTAIDSDVKPKEISFRAHNNSIRAQSRKKPQDRLIDLMA